MTYPTKPREATISEPRSILEFLDALGIEPADLELLAVETGWQERAAKKITAAGLVSALCQKTLAGSASYNDIASAINDVSAGSPSRQAVAGRMNQRCLKMLEALLQLSIGRSIANSTSERQIALFCAYDRVLVQDSSVIKLPAWLFEEFSGVANATGQVCNARIQAVYDLKSMAFLHFSIDPYSKNDLVAAPELELRAGDLVLRDRGYLTLAEIFRHIEVGADFIYRHKTGTTYLDPETGKVLDLPTFLRKNGRIDREVLLNNAARTRVRLVAEPVNEETAALRRMKAKKETRGHDPSKAVLELMGWTIFITNIRKDPFHTLLETYGLRWRIEVIFKAWKSNMQFDVLHRVSALELRISLTARLIMITVEMSNLFKLCQAKMREATGRDLSLLKFTKYVSDNPVRMTRICAWLTQGADASANVCDALRKYCCYDKRKRLNFYQKQRAITLIS